MRTLYSAMPDVACEIAVKNVLVAIPDASDALLMAPNTSNVRSNDRFTSFIKVFWYAANSDTLTPSIDE